MLRQGRHICMLGFTVHSSCRVFRGFNSTGFLFSFQLNLAEEANPSVLESRIIILFLCLVYDLIYSVSVDDEVDEWANKVYF